MAHPYAEIPLDGGPIPGGSPFSASDGFRSRRRRRRAARGQQQETSTPPDPARAVAPNRRYAQSLGWHAFRPRIAAVLGFATRTPDETAFARALALWQARNGLVPDGVLGPKTWSRLIPALSGAPAATPTPASVPAAVSGSAFLKDSPRLRSVPLAPSTPIAIAGGWSSDRRALAATYNRVGGLMSALAQELGVETAGALAVWRVESGGREHTPGRMIIRFENHVLFRRWGEKNRAAYDQHFRHGGHAGQAGRSWEGHQFRESPDRPFETLHTGSQANEYRALQLAIRLAGDEVALQCISMGGPQVMGFNHATLGYATARQMYDAFQADERFHVLGFFDFCRQTPAPARGDLIRYLRERNWSGFARYYNGSGQVETYGALIGRFFREATALPGLSRELALELEDDALDLAPPLDEPDGQDGDGPGPDAGAAPSPEPPATGAPEEPPTWLTADGYVLHLPPSTVRHLVERVASPRRSRRRRQVQRRTGRLARGARRIGTVRDRRSGTEYPVFGGRSGKFRYRIVARPRSATVAEILDVQPEIDEREAEVPADGQLTPSFNIREFYSPTPTSNKAKVVPVPPALQGNVLELARNLQVLRDHLGRTIRINSGYRTPEYNRTLEGAATNSQHLQAKAADISISGLTPAQVYCTIEKLIAQGRMKQGGLGFYRTFVHYDIRGTRSRWKYGVSEYPNCALIEVAPAPGASPAYLPSTNGRSPSAPAGTAETESVRRWIAQGITDESRLTDLVFHARHPELGGRSLRAGEALVAEWTSIRDGIVRPALAAGTGATPVPAGSASAWSDPLAWLRQWLHRR